MHPRYYNDRKWNLIMYASRLILQPKEREMDKQTTHFAYMYMHQMHY